MLRMNKKLVGFTRIPNLLPLIVCYFSHGDMLYLQITKTSVMSNGNQPSTSQGSRPSSASVSNGASANVAGAPNLSIIEDEVDILLSKLDGKIERGKNETM